MITKSQEVTVPLGRIDTCHGKAFQVYTIEGRRVQIADVVLI